MKIPRISVQFMLLVLVLCHMQGHTKADKKSQQKRRTYIVHVDRSHMPASFTDRHQWYDTSLRTASHTAEILYTYNNVIHGFSTSLTAEEAESLEGHPGIIHVLPEVRYELHTTRSPEFLGLGRSEAYTPSSAVMSDVIIGVLDTGVWPESPSYDDTGLGPVPSSWKGACEVGTNFSAANCNRKLIGARAFYRGYELIFGPIDESVETRSPRDDDGHGTHTSTTAAGSVVPGASLFGYAPGTARGMATKARISVYKTCWAGGCFSSDILAAMDKAVEDGVHILSMSIGGSAAEYYRDSIAIGAFTAMTKGVLISCSAGNSGPGSGSVSNMAPWITTVGAGTLDRDFPAYTILGNGKNFTGVSLYSGRPMLISGLIPLVYAGKASNSTNGNLCMGGTLIPAKVAGKIVLCDRGVNARAAKGVVVRDAGGLGMILANTETYGEELVADSHLVPAAAVGQKAAEEIKSYISSDPNPTATIYFAGTEVGVQPSPVVAAFSSRGPNTVTPEVLKPDLIAPGVNILAGWTGKVGPSGLKDDPRRTRFNIISGTSMSCPHVSGLAALVKASHPDWSPAAIKSALMTTAYSTYSKNGATIQDVTTGLPATPFDYGAGHVDPVAALDPGLVYDASTQDYIDFLCALNYSSIQIKMVSGSDIPCSSDRTYSTKDLNYPSFSVALQTASGTGLGSPPRIVKYTRTLTNVGTPATYNVSVSSRTPSVVKIIVEPQSLAFASTYEKKTYTVTFIANSSPSGATSFARLTWTDGKHSVSSPIAFSLVVVPWSNKELLHPKLFQWPGLLRSPMPSSRKLLNNAHALRPPDRCMIDLCSRSRCMSVGLRTLLLPVSSVQEFYWDY